MFTTDTERVIPRRRGKMASIFVQVLLVVLVLLYLAQNAFAVIYPELVEQLSRLPTAALLILIFGTAILVTIYTRWDQRRKWSALAEEMGLKLEQKKRWGFPSITGTFRAHQIDISLIVERRGNRNATFTDFLINLNLVVDETFTIKGRKVTHLNREKTGDEVVDKKLTVSVSSNKLLQRLLNTRRLRLGLIQLGEKARSRQLTLKRKTLHYREYGRISDTEYLRAAVGFLVDLANTIESFEQIER